MIQRRVLLPMVWLLAAVLTGGRADAATIITNGGFTGNNTFPLPGDSAYGSNVATGDAYFSVFPGQEGIVGTPNIAVLMNSSFTNGRFDNGRFDGWGVWPNTTLQLPTRKVLQFDSSASGPNRNWSILFTPESGYDVALTSFVLDAADTTPAGSVGSTNWNWSAVGTTSGTLASGTWARTTIGRDTISVNARGASSEPVSLNFTFNSGAGNYVGLTDISFDQVVAVPEPASLAAAAAVVALGLAGARRRTIGRRGP
jgi:hypothetical protein